MPLGLRTFLNCLLTAFLSYGVFWVVGFTETHLILRGISPINYASDWLSGLSLDISFYFYDVLRFALFGSVAALVMLYLKPRSKVWYCLASIAPLAYTLRIPGVISTGSWPTILISLFWLFTIPALYLLFCRIADDRHNKPLNADAGDAGAG